MEFDAFISHSSKDKTMADAVCAKLERAGIRCWIAPRDITAGKTWSGEIVKAIDRCKVMVLVFTSNANESDQILREVEMAVNRTKPIVPLRIQDIRPTDSIAYFMNSVHWLDAITEPVEAHLDVLVVAVKSLLGRSDGTVVDPVPPVPVPVPPNPIRPKLPLIPIAIGAAVFLALVIVLLIVVFASNKPGPGPAPGPSPAAPASVTQNSGDTSITGTWTLSTQIAGIAAVITNTYSPDGSYRSDTVMNDSGTFQSANGHWMNTSNQGDPADSGTYAYAGPHTLHVTGRLGSALFSPVTLQANLDPNNPIMLGTWQATTHPPNSPPWVTTLTDNPDGTYTSKIEVVDQGNYSSGNGTLVLTSHVLGTTSSYTYQFLDSSKMSTTGPLGTAVWTKN